MRARPPHFIRSVRLAGNRSKTVARPDLTIARAGTNLRQHAEPATYDSKEMQNAVQQVQVLPRTIPHADAEAVEKAAITTADGKFPIDQVAGTGLEDTAFPAGISENASKALQNPMQSTSKAVPPANLTDESDRDLAALVTAWPTLSPAVRASILAFVRSQ